MSEDDFEIGSLTPRQNELLEMIKKGQYAGMTYDTLFLKMLVAMKDDFETFLENREKNENNK